MAEQELELQQNGKYNNLQIRDLAIGNFVIVEKRFAEGRSFESKKYSTAEKPVFNFMCAVKYKGKDTSFWLYTAKEHEQYAQIGGVGDNIKISASAVEKSYMKDGKKVTKLSKQLSFELA